MEQQARHRWAARAVLLLLTVLGLVGMHGLPDAMATSSGATTMPASAAMSPLAVPMAVTEPSPARHGRYADPATHRPAQLTRVASQSTGTSLAAPMGCGMDHANCVAILRNLGHVSAAGPAATVVATPGISTPALVSTPARGPRAPPDVSLIALGISRT